MTLSRGKLRISVTASLLALMLFVAKSGTAATVDYITVTPTDATVDTGQMQAFTANGGMTDGTTKTLSAVTGITTTDWHACAVLASGEVRCWGLDSYGQLGNNDTADTGVPVGVYGIDGNTSHASAVSAGYLYSCALMKSGAVQCWGYNGFGELGSGNTTNSSIPVPVIGINGTDARATSVSTWNYHTCAVLDTGELRCWGGNAYGSLGIGSFSDHIDTPVTVLGINGTDAKATSVAVGFYFTCAALASGAAQCWGRNDYGQLGNGDDTFTASPSPATVSGLSNVAAVGVSAGGFHACALLDSGAVECWGDNTYGQLGDDSTTSSNVPVPVQGIDGTNDTAVAISVGSYHTCALLQSGGVKCWGRNDEGQLGNGSTTDASTPQYVTGLDGSGEVVTQVSTSGTYTCALLESGAVQCWGRNAYGVFGTNTTTSSSVPVTMTEPLGLSWSSSDTSVATIDATGVATAVGPGTATITASFGSLTQTANLTVNQTLTTSNIIEELVDLVNQLEVSGHGGRGVKHHLKHSLRKVWKDLKHNDDKSLYHACKDLGHFARNAYKLSGKKITSDDADMLIEGAQQTGTGLGCGDLTTYFKHW